MRILAIFTVLPGCLSDVPLKYFCKEASVVEADLVRDLFYGHILGGEEF
jgi:hypothetical protein